MPSTICSIENGSVDNHQHISILFYPSYPLPRTLTGKILEQLSHFRSLSGPKVESFPGLVLNFEKSGLIFSNEKDMPKGIYPYPFDFFTIENFWEYFLLEEIDLIDVIYVPMYRGPCRGGSDLNILKT